MTSLLVRVGGACCLAVTLLLDPSARAAPLDDFPNRPVRLLVGFAAGGTTDLMARIAAQQLSEQWGQQVLVDNRPGAGSMIAAALVAQAPPDGYTLLQNSSSHVVAPLLTKQATYDPIKDFTPIAKVGFAPNIIIVGNASPAHDLAALIALARANPGKLSYGMPGYGSITHLSGELFRHMVGLELVPIAYRGGALSVQSVVTGEVPMAFNTLPEVVGQLQAGAVRAIAVTTTGRSSLFPAVPTVAESGVPGYEVEVWQAWLGPAGMPPALTAKIQAALADAGRHPTFRKRMAELGAEPGVSSSAELGAMMQAEHDKWAPLVKSAGIRAE